MHYRTILDDDVAVERISVHPEVQIAAVGDDVTFECTVTHIPPFTVMWMSDKTNVSNESSLLESLNGMVTLPLTLRNVTNTDYHTYTCSAIDNNDDTFVSESALLSKLTSLYYIYIHLSLVVATRKSLM